MATRWAISDGDWNTDSIWNDGTNLGIPADGDIVYLNGHILTVDNLPIDAVDNYSYLFSANSSSIIRNDANTDLGIVAGGTFNKTIQGNIKINATLYSYNNTGLFRMQCTSTATKNVIVNGDIYSYESSCTLSMYGTTTSHREIGLVINGDIYSYGTARVCNMYSLAYLIIIGHTVHHTSTNILFNPTNAFGYTNINSNIIIDGGGSLFTALVPTGALSFVGNISISNNSYLMKRTGSTTVTFSTANNIIINGNLTISDNSKFLPLVATSTNAPTFTLNGNLYLDNTTSVTNPTGTNVNQEFILFTYYNTMIFNGHIICNGTCSGRLLSGQTSYGSITFNGNIDFSGDISINLSSQRVTTFGANCEFIKYDSNWLFPITLTRPYTINNSNGINVIYNGDSNQEFVILGKFNINNRQQYPAESDVRKDVEYAWGAMKGIMESGVQVGCVTKEDVREGVPLLGMDEVGTCAVPSPDDVREGVPVDNTIGTLIVQGGGDRLRIADFGYYTNAQSDTYIVDITEADKPKFASAEERILIEMFPSLDLDNIPQMYFDDLFVKYLKYRLIVEYYRTAGINSTFTPSEPTTEIVNYRNVTCEVWLNSANIYLNAWNKKYGLNKPPKKVRL